MSSRNKSIIKITLTINFFVAAFFTLSAESITDQIIRQIHTSDIRYILSFDGGGSKTALQVLDQSGQPITFHQDEKSTTTILGEGTNINTAGKAEVQRTLFNMCNQFILSIDTALTSILKNNCLVVGGFAGAGTAQNIEILNSTFQALGFSKDKIIIASDAAMCLESVEAPGIIVIAGTGCICFGKKGTEQFRVGGLGPRIDSNGSGYHVGIATIKAALEYAYGWGTTTSLTEIVKKHFDVSDIKSIVGPINQATIPVQHIAQLSKKVFEAAFAGDLMSIHIFRQTAAALGNLINTMIIKYQFDPCPIYFFGGLFKSSHADDFIKTIMQATNFRLWTTVNKSSVNPTTIVIQQAQACANR